MSLERELDTVKSCVFEAAGAILRISGGGFEADYKADKSPFTAADLEANRILKEALMGEFGEYGWLSEETRDDRGRLECERVWIVDPIDGTREFVMGIPEFAVSVALVERGEVVLGVVCNPSTDELFEAVRGGGAKLNGEVVNCDHPFAGHVVVEASRSDIEKGRFVEFESLFEIRPCGSIAYKLARLAAGMSDSVFSLTPKNEWDIAAGVLLVRESGGRVGRPGGEAFVFNRADTVLEGVVAASSAAYETVCSIIHQQDAKF